MAYESLIEDFDLIQGDSSPIWFFGLPDGSSLNDGNWNAQCKIMEDYGKPPLVGGPRTLSLNSGTGLGDEYPIGSKFVFQILPSESAQLLPNTKYAIVVEIWNESLNYMCEVARFKCKVLQGS